jgi:hypothetical protein
MSTITTRNRPNVRTRRRLVATLLVAAAVLWVGAYLQHPPGEGVSLARTMQVVVDHTTAWRWSHLGIAAGYLAAGLAALIRVRRPAPGSRLGEIGWLAMAVAAVPLVGYLVVESSVATQAALAGDADGFGFWYGTVAVWAWRAAWPGFFVGMALVAADARGSGTMPRWSTFLAAGGAGFGVLAPVFSVVGLSSWSFAAFITPLVAWVWLAVLGLRGARASEDAS